MKIYRVSNNLNFRRRLKPNEEADYRNVLNQAKAKAGNRGKSILIVPSSSLPNETGVGNLATKESNDFFNFARIYWGINEVQILPCGQYHKHNGTYPFYSGTSMELGSHIIDIRNYVSENDYNEITKSNIQRDHVNFSNVIDRNSAQEKSLLKLYESRKMRSVFEKFKQTNSARLEKKALYRALGEINGHYDYKKWNEVDKNLYNTEIVSDKVRTKRISEIYAQKGKEIDFYYFKQFLAEDSLKRAKNELNQNGIKLNGDMPCGFSYDEIWANPKAFHKDTTIGWGLPALDLSSPAGRELLKEKVKFYVERFDGIRIDAAWTYVNQPLIKNGNTIHNDYANSILNIIDEGVRKIKGNNYNIKNIMYEFSASSEDFNIYDGSTLKPYVENRMKIYTSDNLSEDWGSNKNFLGRGWNPDSFIMGASNHDSKQIKFSETQAKALSKILNIPYKKLTSEKEFMKAKMAEPMSARNNMIYFIDALNLKEQFLNNEDKSKDYTTLIPKNYQKYYFNSLKKGEGFNPMDALQKVFKAKGLNKSEPKLYRKIVKYKKILEQDEKEFRIKKFCIIACAAITATGLLKYLYDTKIQKKNCS